MGFSLLVVDKATEDYYRKLDMIVSSEMPNIDRRSSAKAPSSPPPEIPDSDPEVEPESTKLPERVVAKFQIDDDDEGLEAGVDEDEEDAAQPRLPSRSSSSSADKVTTVPIHSFAATFKQSRLLPKKLWSVYTNNENSVARGCATKFEAILSIVACRWLHKAT
jgi:hypothetical protein